LTGFFAFFLDSIERKSGLPDTWKKVLIQRNFGLYLLAYIFFKICSGLVTVIWSARPDELVWEVANANANILRSLGIAVIAVISGFFADRVGRKKPVIIGLIFLGLGYALVSLEFTPDTFFVQHIISGLAWGILIVMYTTIPGDLASVGSAEKFYTLGVIVPFILYMSINGLWRFINFSPRLDIFSTILSMVLFLSVIPILYAAESLSESKIQEFKLKKYTEKVREVVQDSEKI
jgi:MFS family permease